MQTFLMSGCVLLAGAVGVALSFPVRVIAQLAGFLQGLKSLGSNRQLARRFESGLRRYPIVIRLAGLLPCRHATSIRRP
jgi:hypothetical protein